MKAFIVARVVIPGLSYFVFLGKLGLGGSAGRSTPNNKKQKRARSNIGVPRAPSIRPSKNNISDKADATNRAIFKYLQQLYTWPMEQQNSQYTRRWQS
jgi:hypothetical protein